MDLIKLKLIKFSFLESYGRGTNSDPKYDWGVLKKSITENGWCPSKFGYITISKDSYCINGHHRVVLLKEMYGEDFKVEVIRLKYNYKKIFLKNLLKDLIKFNFKRKKWYL